MIDKNPVDSSVLTLDILAKTSMGKHVGTNSNRSFFLSLVSAYDRDTWMAIDEKANSHPTSVSSSETKLLSYRDVIIMRARDADRATIRESHRKVEGHRFAIPRGYHRREVRVQSPEKFFKTNRGGSPEISLEKKEIKMTRLSRHVCPKIPRDMSRIRSELPR